jgi:hypothetical protein
MHIKFGLTIRAPCGRLFNRANFAIFVAHREMVKDRGTGMSGDVRASPV